MREINNRKLVSLLVSLCLYFGFGLPCVFGEEDTRKRFSVIFDIRNHEDKIIPAKIHFIGHTIPPIETDEDYYEVILSEDLYKIYVYADGYTTWEKEIYVNSDMVVSVHLEKGGPTLPPTRKALLVVDNNGAEGKRYYEQVLRSSYLSFDTRIGTADRNTLLKYPLVIWFFGSESENILNGHERRALIDYVGGGGNLIICGENIGKPLKKTFFYQKVLGAKYRRNNAFFLLVVDARDETKIYKINGEDSVDTMMSPDVIKPSNSNVKVLYNYKRLGGSAVLHNRYGRGSAAYIAFGLEAVSGSQERKEILNRIRYQSNLSRSENRKKEKIFEGLHH